MKEKHTPGPWHAADRGIGWEVHHGESCSARCDRALNGGFRETFKESDARLIATAPELLHALREILRDLPTKRDWLDPDLERIAKAAIAKAEGQ